MPRNRIDALASTWQTDDMKRLLALFRAFTAFLDRNPALDRQRRIAAELYEPSKLAEIEDRAEK
jgi:hypothetical protein